MQDGEDQAEQGPVALTIDPDTVCFLIIKARAFAAMVAPEGLESGSNPADDAESTVLFDLPDNTAAREFAGTLASLNRTERAEVLAMVWLGREDYDVDQWPEAVEEARGQPETQRANALLGIPMLADFLEGGLWKLGYDCAEVEAEHL